MLKLIAVFVIAFLGRLLGHASGYVIGFRGGRPLLERPGRTLKLRLKTIDRGEKLFERFAWRGALEAPGAVSGINTVPVRPSCLHLVRQFYPAVFIVEMQTLLLCLLSCQVGEEVA